MAQANRLTPSGGAPPSRNAPLTSSFGRIAQEHVKGPRVDLSTRSLPAYTKPRPAGTTTMPAGAPAPLPGAPGGGPAGAANYPGASSTVPPPTAYGSPSWPQQWQSQQVYQQQTVPVNVSVVTQPQLSNTFTGQPQNYDLGPMTSASASEGLRSYLSGRCLAYAAVGVLLAVVFGKKSAS